MRLLFYAGKGGVGKTSVSAATGIRLAQLGYRTLVMSLDPAHSLRDSFDLERRLMDGGGGKTLAVMENLWIQEVDVQEELTENWNEVYNYVSGLLNLTGLQEILADEVAILPGMEEVSCLLHINRYYKEKTFDVIILDCAPTGESLRFISMPTTLEWYIKNVFRFERALVRTVRPFAKYVMPVPLPQDQVFADMQALFERLDGVQELLQDPKQTSVRLVTNPEKIVVKETQRAFMYFCLYGLTIDAIVVNRIIPPEVGSHFVEEWVKIQSKYLEEIKTRFAPTDIWTVELFDREIVGLEGLRVLADSLYRDKDPSLTTVTESPHRFLRRDGELLAQIRLPFVGSEDVDVSKSGDELILRIGGFKKHLDLPRSFLSCQPTGAKIQGDYLWVSFGKGGDDNA